MSLVIGGYSRQSLEGRAFDSGAEGFAVIPRVFGGAEAHTLLVAFAAGDDTITGLCHLDTSFEARLNSMR